MCCILSMDRLKKNNLQKALAAYDGKASAMDFFFEEVLGRPLPRVRLRDLFVIVLV